MNRFFPFFLLFLFVPAAVTGLTLPANLAKLQDQNQLIAEQTLAQVTFGIAFLAGLVTFLSPCVLPILLMFMASSLQQPTGRARRFFFFLLGMSTMLVVMGVVVGYLGKMSLDFFPYRGQLAQLAGFGFIMLGVSILGGLSFGRFSLPYRPAGAYSAGLLFAFGWTACTGPVLAGVIAMAALLQNLVHAGFLLFFYALGIGFPFLAVATLAQNRVQPLSPRVAKTLSGILYIIVGGVLLFFQSTAVFNSLEYGLTGYYYLAHDFLLTSPGWLSIVGLLLLVVFVSMVYTIFRGGSHD